MERVLTAADFNELTAFEVIEPYGTEAQTDNFRMLAAIIHGANYKTETGKPLQPQDFMKRYELPEIAEERRQYEQAEMLRRFFERRLKKE